MQRERNGIHDLFFFFGGSMNRVNKSLLTAAVIAGLTGGIGFVNAGQLGNSSSSQQAEEKQPKHIHMHNAKEALKEARGALEKAEDVFKGHREEALAHVDHAIKEIQTAVDEAGGESSGPADRPAVSQLDEGRFPHMHKAAERMEYALSELQTADKFNGHRDAAIDEVQKGLDQLHKAIKDAER
jgi:hypothetical protein